MVTEREINDATNQESSGSELGSPLLNLTCPQEKSSDSINTNPLPHGKYTVIGVDIDTTGRRLIDEIVQISAYTPSASFSQVSLCPVQIELRRGKFRYLAYILLQLDHFVKK
jgi:maternal-effect protein exuperantia